MAMPGAAWPDILKEKSGNAKWETEFYKEETEVNGER